MTLIKSISGIRGTIGGKVGENLTPVDIVKFSAAFAMLLKNKFSQNKIEVVVGRDSRISGKSVSDLVINTLLGSGIDVMDLSLATTPTVEMSVLERRAQGGIIISASHNPENWNALKLLNELGEFISIEDGKKLINISEKEDFVFSDVFHFGKFFQDNESLEKHIKKIITHPLVKSELIAKADFKVAIDGINSVGGFAVPAILKALGVNKIEKINCDSSGVFTHNPEPLPENLVDISCVVREKKCDLGFAVDPDVDRLAIIDENGNMFGEEYTLVSVADYVLSKVSGNTVSNLSSSRALRDVTEKRGGRHYASAVGELNVVNKMKEVDAVIGGEGNGGVILPELHYGRDALIGIALFLSQLAERKLKVSELKKEFPAYHISKNKIELSPDVNVDFILQEMEARYKKENCSVNSIDGVKIDFEKEWVHLRRSNTEPIIRIYAESDSKESSEKLAKNIISEIKLLKK